VLILAASRVGAGEGASPGVVIGFDLDRLDARGLQGPPDGLRALDYEYCIPDSDAHRAWVMAIDPGARFLPGGPGRIGCRPNDVLVLGNTRQPGYRAVLRALAELPFVERIAECVFE
jgi:hypothetical protein